MNRLIESTREAVRSDPKKAVVGAVALVVLAVGLFLIGRSLFAGPSIGPVSTGGDSAGGAPGEQISQSQAYEREMDPARGQRQGNRYLAPTGK
jgi:hypothetical protein